MVGLGQKAQVSFDIIKLINLRRISHIFLRHTWLDHAYMGSIWLQGREAVTQRQSYKGTWQTMLQKTRVIPQRPLQTRLRHILTCQNIVAIKYRKALLFIQKTLWLVPVVFLFLFVFLRRCMICNIQKYRALWFTRTKYTHQTVAVMVSYNSILCNLCAWRRSEDPGTGILLTLNQTTRGQT